MTPDRPRPTHMRARLIPDGLIPLPADLVDARDRAADAIDSLEQAREAHVEAKRAADAAPVQDADAKYEALAGGKKAPAATAPKLAEAASDAATLVDVAQDRADAALAEMNAVRDAHKDKLTACATEVGEAQLAAVREGLQGVQGMFDRLAELSGVVTAIHLDQAWRPAPKALRSGPNIDRLLSELQAAAGDLWEQAVPLEMRLLAAVGSGSTWDEVAERLGRKPLDTDACTIRGRLLKEGRLAYTAQLGDGRERRLVPSTPPETSADRSRRLRRERGAASERAA